MGLRSRQQRLLSSSSSSRRAATPVTIALWSLAAAVVLLNLYAAIDRREAAGIEAEHPPVPRSARELEDAEEESFRLAPPRSRRNPRAAKRQGDRRPPTVVEEFLDESSEVHAHFFPGLRQVVDPADEEGRNGGKFFYPGRVWLDTAGRPIQAHGGGVLYDAATKTFFWYGENKEGETYKASENFFERVDIVGVSCYSSKDLWAWKNEGVVLAGEATNMSHDLYKSNVLERPKVMYNDHTGKYVMWMHIDDANYTKASVGVAVGDSPTGPFTYLYSISPHGFESRDMTAFKDDDGRAYLIYSSDDNRELHVSPLTDDYLGVASTVSRVLVGQRREAPAVFKHEGTYYMVTSGCTGWAPNEALLHAAQSILGPWETLGNPCEGGNEVFRSTTFFSQGTFVLPLPGFTGLFVFMADRWKPADLGDSRYVWLPMSVRALDDKPAIGFSTWPRVSVYWHRRWQLPDRWLE